MESKSAQFGSEATSRPAVDFPILRRAVFFFLAFRNTAENHALSCDRFITCEGAPIRIWAGRGFSISCRPGRESRDSGGRTNRCDFEHRLVGVWVTIYYKDSL